MKKILFLLSILTLLSYGCNRNEDAATDTGAGMQQEETQNPSTLDSGEMQESPESMEGSQQNMEESPSMQEEEVRDEYQTSEDLDAVPAEEQESPQQ